MLRQKSLMHRAMPFPQNHFGSAQTFGCEAAVDQIRVPYHHFIEWDSHAISGVAPQMLVGKEKKFFVLRECPLESARRIRGCTDHAAAFTTKCLDCARRIHVCNGSNALACLI